MTQIKPEHVAVVIALGGDSGACFLAGPRIHWEWARVWGGAVAAFVLVMGLLHSHDPRAGRPPNDPRYTFPSEAKLAGGKLIPASTLMMDDYKAILAMAGMTMDDLVSVTIYCPDLNLYSTFNEIYRTYFTKGFPARAFIGSGPLLFGMRFEMQAIAIKR